MLAAGWAPSGSLLLSLPAFSLEDQKLLDLLGTFSRERLCREGAKELLPHQDPTACGPGRQACPGPSECYGRAPEQLLGFAAKDQQVLSCSPAPLGVPEWPGPAMRSLPDSRWPCLPAQSKPLAVPMPWPLFRHRCCKHAARHSCGPCEETMPAGRAASSCRCQIRSSAQVGAALIGAGAVCVYACVQRGGRRVESGRSGPEEGGISSTGLHHLLSRMFPSTVLHQ